MAAWYEPKALVVRDLFTRAEVSRRPEASLPDGAGTWDLQSDG